MAAMRMICDCWDGPNNHNVVREAPSQPEFDEAFERLDAQVHTMVVLDAGGERHMSIGGGAGQYVVYATFDNEEFWNLLRKAPTDGVVMLNAGGQEGDFPARQVVGQEEARQAGRSFLASCNLDRTLQWEKS